MIRPPPKFGYPTVYMSCPVTLVSPVQATYATSAQAPPSYQIMLQAHQATSYTYLVTQLAPQALSGPIAVTLSDDHSIPVTNTGHSILPTSVRPLQLINVLITPHIVKNLISVRQFVHDNNCKIKFDAFGFSVKNFMTRWVLLRCDSTGDLYPVMQPSPILRVFLVSQHTWHQRLGHLGGDVLRRLVSNNVISCNNEKPPVLYHVCQLGKHVRLSF
ncbi:ribonuclease H-like domain-containing protein, partial [Tanacetum coccineum]